ncbi:MAG: hypothetical protein RIT43_1058 [Bacteroidota bacterium]|jgi:hypothetical protein
MKKLILTCAVLLAFYSEAAKKNPWTLPEGELLHVYRCLENDRSTELVRLFADGIYEHLLYERKSSRREQVERNLGSYVIRKGKIEFTKPTQTEFTGKFKYGSFQFKDGKLFLNMMDAVFKSSNEAFKRTDEERYRKPFFIKLNKDEVVNNSGADDLLKLNDLLKYLLKEKKTEAEKLNALESFIARTVAYDDEGFTTGKPKNDQTNVLAILAGTNRTALCLGYAITVRKLCEEAGLSCRKVDGFTRDHSTMEMLSAHSWNLISVDGQNQLHDLTWADKGEELDLKWINAVPEVFINSHYPQNQGDQLLSMPISKDEFQSRLLIRSSTKLSALPATNLKRVNFFKDKLEFQVDGAHSVQVYQLPAALLNVVFRGESPTITFSPKPMDAEVSTKDGKTNVSVPLNDHLYFVRVVIDGVVETEVRALRNGPEAVFNHYMSMATNKFADPFVRGILSAIKMKDTERLKALVGDTNTAFFNEKKKLILDQKVLTSINSWSGEVSALTKQVSVIEFFDDEGNTVEEEKEEFFIETPGKLKVFLTKEEATYRVDRIEFATK